MRPPCCDATLDGGVNKGGRGSAGVRAGGRGGPLSADIHTHTRIRNDTKISLLGVCVCILERRFCREGVGFYSCVFCHLTPPLSPLRQYVHSINTLGVCISLCVCARACTCVQSSVTPWLKEKGTQLSPHGKHALVHHAGHLLCRHVCVCVSACVHAHVFSLCHTCMCARPRSRA